MNEDTTQAAMYEHDMEIFQQQALEALRASQTRPLTEDEGMLLAWLGGLSNDFYKEIRK